MTAYRYMVVDVRYSIYRRSSLPNSPLLRYRMLSARISPSLLRPNSHRFSFPIDRVKYIKIVWAIAITPKRIASQLSLKEYKKKIAFIMRIESARHYIGADQGKSSARILVFYIVDSRIAWFRFRSQLCYLYFRRGHISSYIDYSRDVGYMPSSR